MINNDIYKISSDYEYRPYTSIINEKNTDNIELKRIHEEIFGESNKSIKEMEKDIEKELNKKEIENHKQWYENN